jgi:D-glycero-alpha-D-manno-heptose 1-phosphate guanylyltransferase
MKNNFVNNIDYYPLRDGGFSSLGVGGLEAIILAGGLGTRLRSAVPDLPKCMAPVNGRPFIAYVIDYLLEQGVTKFILSLGYKHEAIIDFIETNYSPLTIHHSPLTIHHARLSFQYSIEEEPLGTGGGIRYACLKTTEDNVIVANGDTIFKANVMEVASHHIFNEAHCTLSLKPMQNFNRYGVVELNEDNSIKNFKEKQQYEEGLINGGLYVLNTKKFLSEYLPLKFSFEKDYLEALYTKRKMFGVVQDAYFIDIGIPEDYARAQTELING